MKAGISPVRDTSTLLLVNLRGLNAGPPTNSMNSSTAKSPNETLTTKRMSRDPQRRTTPGVFAEDQKGCVCAVLPEWDSLLRKLRDRTETWKYRVRAPPAGRSAGRADAR